MKSLLEQFRNLLRYWWAFLIVGLAVCVIGVLIFVYPARSYMTMAVVFAILMIISGIMQLVAAFTEKYLPGRGWLAALGAIELIVGVILLVNPGVSALALPFVLGFWLLFRGINLISIASEMRALKISGTGWTIALAVLLIICSLVILFNPIIYGAPAVIAVMGVAILVSGVALCVFAFQLMSLRKKYKDLLA